jgi:hypothetical protein
VTEVRPGQAWTNEDGDHFVVVGRLTDGTGCAVSRGKVKVDRMLDEQFADYRLAPRQPDNAP